jgi:hypothetical protein
MRGDDLLDLTRPDLETTGLDQILLAIDDEDVAVLVNVAEVPGVERALTSIVGPEISSVSAGRFQ